MLSSNFDNVDWVAGALACATSSFIMSATNTVHPPGGATALLTATNSQIRAMGWMFIPFMLLGTVVMLTIALLINNIQRQYPKYWWTAEALPRRKVNDLEKVNSNLSEQTLRDDMEPRHVSGGHDSIVVTAERVLVPESFELTEAELSVLGKMQQRLHDTLGREEMRSMSIGGP